MKEKSFNIPEGVLQLARSAVLITILISFGALQDLYAMPKRSKRLKTAQTLKTDSLSSDSGAKPSLIEFDHIEQDVVVFSRTDTNHPSTTRLKTSLHDLSFLGRIDSQKPGVEPYFLFGGKTCEDCLEDKMIYAIKPSGGKPNAFVYPGKILQPKNRELVFKSNAYIGRCLRNIHDDVLVIFQDEKIERKHRKPSMVKSVLVAQPGSRYLKETLIEKNFPNRDHTAHLVRTKQCKEIEGRNRFTFNKLLEERIPASDSDTDQDDSDSNSDDAANTAQRSP